MVHKHGWLLLLPLTTIIYPADLIHCHFQVPGMKIYILSLLISFDVSANIERFIQMFLQGYFVKLQ